MKDRWWQRAPRRPGLVLAAAMLMALAVSAGITAMLTAGGGSHRPLAAGVGLGAGVSVPSSSAVPAGTGPASRGPASTGPVPSGSAATSARPTPRAPVSAGPSSPAARGPATGGPSAPPTAPAAPSPSSSPPQGYLLLAPDHLMLTSKPGKPASGFFVLTAEGGPVSQYTVRVAAKAGRVSVAPAAGSLALNGFVEVTVTVTSKAALTSQIVVEPGNLAVTVVYQPKPAPAPSAGPSPGTGPEGE